MSVVKYKIFSRDRDNAAAGIAEGSDKIVLKSTPDIWTFEQTANGLVMKIGDVVVVERDGFLWASGGGYGGEPTRWALQSVSGEGFKPGDTGDFVIHQLPASNAPQDKVWLMPVNAGKQISVASSFVPNPEAYTLEPVSN